MNHYEILGVSSRASQEAIKKAYRRLAMQYHPDRNAHPEAAAAFKQLTLAYRVLSDPEQRAAYDRALKASTPPLSVRLFDALADKFSALFRWWYERHPPNPLDVESVVKISLEEAFRGSSQVIPFGESRIAVKLPPGIETGTRVRLKGQGRPSPNGGPPGDLYVNVIVLPHPVFSRSGDTLMCKLHVDPGMAQQGREIGIEVFDGVYKWKLPPQTRPGQLFRLRGLGMPKLNRPEKRGDLYITII
jgi:curved DNA-binding protein